jgi:TrmH family RNA methyltransferase
MITSLQNSTIKEVIKLSKSAERKQQQLCVVEGNREVSIAQQFGFDFVDIFVCHDIFKTDEEYPINFEGNFQVMEVSKEVYAKMSYRNGSEGIMAVINTNENKVRNFEPNENSLVLVLESIEKPGNIGAMLRTADATKVDAVILCNAVTDVFNPNAIRSSLGCVFAVPIFTSNSDACVEFLIQHNFQILVASLQTENNFYHQNLKTKTAIVFGSESDGLSEVWYQNTTPVKLPMSGKIDSLNVSASCAAMLFEAVRQKMQ